MSQPTVATRLYAVERDSSRHELELVDHDNRIGDLETGLAVVAARIGIYATLGAAAGGAIVSGAVAFFTSR